MYKFYETAPHREICPFCQGHPYEYVDVGVGMMPVAITCCPLGSVMFDRRPPDAFGARLQEIGAMLQSQDRAEFDMGVLLANEHLSDCPY